MMASVYLDADQHGDLNRLLGDAGHDVRTLVTPVSRRRTDIWHLRTASSEGRAIVTFNERDFRFSHRLWTSLGALGVTSLRHSGILTSTAQITARSWLQVLDELLRSGRDVAGRMLIWHSTSHEWREDRYRPEED